MISEAKTTCLVFNTGRKHRKQWVELLPQKDGAFLSKEKQDPDFDPFTDEYCRPQPVKYSFRGEDWEVVIHDKPSDNLQKLLDAGYLEASAVKILDTLGLE